MKTIIYYFSGTGNSLWAARQLAEELGETELVPMARYEEKAGTPTCPRIGLVFPVHMWGVPPLVLAFLKKMPKDASTYYFALGVNAGQVSRTLVQLKEVLEGYGLALASAYEIKMPTNYIPWGGPGPLELQQKRFAAAKEKIKHIAATLQAGKKGGIEKGPLWQRIIFTALYHLAQKKLHEMDRAFWVDEKCNGCGICTRVCPVGNVRLEAEKPLWAHGCVQCLACLQWCPQQALQYGKKTPQYERYHHPEIQLKDFI